MDRDTLNTKAHLHLLTRAWEPTTEDATEDPNIGARGIHVVG